MRRCSRLISARFNPAAAELGGPCRGQVAGRPSPATASKTIHDQELADLMEETFRDW
jgi:hypothetical protein